jgi:membrane fusion protein, macrolide-specific efflux system
MMWSARHPAVVAMAVAIAIGGGWMLKTKLFPKQVPNWASATVGLADIEETVLASGILKPVKMVAVGAQVSGRVISLNVAVGQTIKQGDLIAQIDPVTKQNDLRTAEAALENMRAQRSEKEATLGLAEASLARQQITFSQKASSRADYETADATVKQTRAQIAALDAQITEAAVSVENARVNLDYTRITAPIDGTVLAVVTQAGQTVNAVQSAPTIAILGQIEMMTIRAEISEVDVIKVKPGQEVYFTILGDPFQRYTATLDSIEPAPESVKNDSSFSSSSSTPSSTSSSASTSSTTSAIYYNGVFTAANSDGRLRTYMTTEVHIVVARAKNALTIPSAAISERNGDGTYRVQALEPGGTASPRNVKIGLNNKLTAEVLQGLKEGEQVVTGKVSADAGGSQSQMGGPPMGF